MNKIYLLIVSLIFAACGPAAIPDTDASVEVDASTGPTDHEFMLRYNNDVYNYQHEVGMSGDWWYWMLAKKSWWSKAYISPRRYDDHNVTIYVRYADPAHPIVYTPAWSSESDHFLALQYMAELQYPGWIFNFVPYYNGVENDLQGNDAIAILGGHDASYAIGHTVYLVYETIFGHEYGHTLGLHHHYCGSSSDHCEENFPPGEGLCLMDRTSVSFGPTENSFLLLTTRERKDDEINAAMTEILRRYPPNFAAAPWDECRMKEVMSNNS